MKPVIVKWIDSQVNSGWLDEKSLEYWLENGLIEVVSVGFLVHEDSDMIAIAMSEFNGDRAEVMKIPLRCVLELSHLIVIEPPTQDVHNRPKVSGLSDIP